MLDIGKGVAVGTVIKLILAILIASSFISITTIGPLGDALKDSFDAITGQTDFTAEISNKKQFSQLAMFVRDRSDQCSRVRTRNEGDVPSGYQGRPQEDITPDGRKGYPALSKFEHLGQKPDCVGGESNSFLRGEVSPQSDFMPGILSRERFEIKSPIFLDKAANGQGSSEYWIEHNFHSISGYGPKKMVYNNPYSDIKENEEFTGTGPNYVIFFKNHTVAEARSNLLIQNPPSGNIKFDESIWKSGYYNGEQTYSVDIRWPWDSGFSTKLCPGDEGYIQRNVGVPHNTGVKSAQFLSGFDDYYPMIVIEETEKLNCKSSASTFTIQSVSVKHTGDGTVPGGNPVVKVEMDIDGGPAQGRGVVETSEETWKWDQSFVGSTTQLEDYVKVEREISETNHHLFCSESANFTIEDAQGAAISNEKTVNLSKEFDECMDKENGYNLELEEVEAIDAGLGWSPGFNSFKLEVTMDGWDYGQAVLQANGKKVEMDHSTGLGSKALLFDTFKIAGDKNDVFCADSGYIYVKDSNGKISPDYPVEPQNLVEGISGFSCPSSYQ